MRAHASMIWHATVHLVGLGQPSVMTGVARAPMPVMPTEAQSSLQFKQPAGTSHHILYHRGQAPVARAPHSSET